MAPPAQAGCRFESYTGQFSFSPLAPYLALETDRARIDVLAARRPVEHIDDDEVGAGCELGEVQGDVR